MLRDAPFFRDIKGVEARPRTEALCIDRAKKTVLVRNLDSGAQETLPYDKLVLATGSTPRKLPIAGAQLPGVFTVADLDAAVAIRAQLTAGAVGRAVVVGAGFIGLEMAVALADMVLAVFGVREILAAPQVLLALNPAHAGRQAVPPPSRTRNHGLRPPPVRWPAYPSALP